MTPDVLSSRDPAAVERAVSELASGRAVVLPTESVYGLFACVDAPDAVRLLRQFPKPPITGPLTLHLPPGVDSRQLLAGALPPATARRFRTLTRKAWPGPLAIIVEATDELAGQLLQQLPESAQSELFQVSGEGVATIALRCPADDTTEQVLRRLMNHTPARLVVAVGVNGTGSALATDARTTANAVAARPEIAEAVRLVIDGGPARYGKPSSVVKLADWSLSVIRPGVWDERTIQKFLKTEILFVCTGNTCRSPMAAALARRAIAEKLGIPDSELETHDIDVHSAGVAADSGSPASDHAVTVLSRMGIDLTSHRSRSISAELVNRADHIFAMTPGHIADLVAIFPSAQRKVQLLAAKSISDPFGGSLADYQRTAEQISTEVTRVVRELEL